jgi:hypothetical protein
MLMIEITEELLEAVAAIAGAGTVEDPETEAGAAAGPLPTDAAEFSAPPSVEP